MEVGNRQGHKWSVLWFEDVKVHYLGANQIEEENLSNLRPLNIRNYVIRLGMVELLWPLRIRHRMQVNKQAIDLGSSVSPPLAVPYNTALCIVHNTIQRGSVLLHKARVPINQ